MEKIKSEQSKVLKEIIGRKWKNVPQLDIYSTIKYDTFGIKVEDGDIIELGLFRDLIYSLPESIGNLKSLKRLYLHNNRLTTLPESIGNLSSLENLSLAENDLTTLPESISNLKSLEHLLLDSNKLRRLPESLRKLSSLQTLNLNFITFVILPKALNILEKRGVRIYINKEPVF